MQNGLGMSQRIYVNPVPDVLDTHYLHFHCSWLSIRADSWGAPFPGHEAGSISMVPDPRRESLHLLPAFPVWWVGESEREEREMWPFFLGRLFVDQFLVRGNCSCESQPAALFRRGITQAAPTRRRVIEAGG